MRVREGLLVACGVVMSYPMYQDNIPNGANVPNAPGVGHWNVGGGELTSSWLLSFVLVFYISVDLLGGPRNPFGLDFVASGYEWTKDLCLKVLSLFSYTVILVLF